MEFTAPTGESVPVSEILSRDGEPTYRLFEIISTTITGTLGETSSDANTTTTEEGAALARTPDELHNDRSDASSPYPAQPQNAVCGMIG